MTQDSRQALIELLFLALYMDDHLSVAEDEVLTEALDSLGWESARSRETFLLAAFSSARTAAGDIEKTNECFSSRAGIIKRDGCEAESLTWLTKVFAADGLTRTEKFVLSQLQEFWYPA